MLYVEKDGLQLHYTDHGAGEPIVTLHGLSESTLYWTLPGDEACAVTDPNFRFPKVDTTQNEFGQ